MTGWLYDLTFRGEGEFRASGLDAANRIRMRLDAALKTALANDPEVQEITGEPYLDATSSPKNFPEKSHVD